MNIGVIGAGAVGLLVASYLSKSNAKVNLYTNSKEQADIINKKGLTIIKNNEEETYTVKTMPFSSFPLNEDILFIAVKQYHLESVIPKLLKRSPQYCSLIFLQNGMGHLDYLPKFKHNSVFVGIVEHGALKHSASVVEHTGLGSLKIGPYNVNNQELKDVWDRLKNVGFETSVHNDWLEIMKKKMAINSVVNPLTALFGVENGQLLNNKYALSLMKRIFNESCVVLHLTHNDELWGDLVKICEKTSRNRSSMLRDFEMNRQTEIDSISGYILSLTKKQGLELPYTTFVYESIKGLELYKERRI